VILVDTSGVLALYDRADRRQSRVVEALKPAGTRILSPFVLAELDYLIPRFGGQPAELALLEDVARGAFQLEQILADDVDAGRGFIQQYADLRLGLADASIMVLAQRYNCLDLLTFDQRHFRAVLGPGDKPFRLVPDDL
jgi:predicted nucleic acid-binding protein